MTLLIENWLFTDFSQKMITMLHRFVNLLFCCVFVVSAQECRLVPVCDQIGISGGSASDIKGDKGDQGTPGKSGPPGQSIKGSRGDPGDCNATLSTIMTKLERIENQLEQIKDFKFSMSRAQQINPEEREICHIEWTVFQRRFDGSVSFDRTWREYKKGFGNLNGEFWLGLEKIHLLTNNRACRLRVDLEAFNGEEAFAEYRVFAVGNESDNYRLHVDSYRNCSTAGDSLRKKDRPHDTMQFSTKDKDNDLSTSNCASVSDQKGGWWHNDCHHQIYASLNGPWGVIQRGGWKKILWFTFKGASEALKETTMKLYCE